MRRSTVALVGLLALVFTAGLLATLIPFVGYCGADFLPIDDDLTVEPYVQNVTATSASILWRTPDESGSLLQFGETPNLDQTIASNDVLLHHVEITGLKPDSEYSYRVMAVGFDRGFGSFRTAPGPDAIVTAAVVGDTGSGEEPQYEVAEVMSALDPDLVLHTGDVVYPRGGECHYDDRYYAPYQGLIDSVPVYPVLGNHDIRTDNGEPYLKAFDFPADSSGTERFYSFDYGPMHITAIDSELYYEDESIPPSAQKAWLIKDLRRTDRPWKVVVIHRPPFNSAPYHGGDPKVLEDLVEIFTAEGVDVVFSGHEHVYERLKPIGGVTYFVTGGGGGDLRGAGTSELTAVSALRYHALRLEVGPERLVVEAVGVGGEVFDRVELTHVAA
ncbi:MAG: metallophosphoesterase [Chloroflexota bacterium]|nr:metallophosphoesterase [Chloroflexota bacterium]